MLETVIRDGLAILRLDSPPLNTLTVQLLEQLRASVRRAEDDPGVSGIVITGGPDHFSAGADVQLFQQIHSDDDAIRLSQTFQEAFQAIEDCSKPVAAALAGTVVGGALELAMACHRRVAVQDARFRMPEVTLGINPGAGGTQRLPRLIGVEAALRMLLKAEVVPAAAALRGGLVDALASREQLLDRAAECLRDNPSPFRTGQRTDRIADRASCERALQQAASSLPANRPDWIAPQQILEAVRTGIEQSFQAGLVKEREAFARCVATRGARNCMHLFFATRIAGKVPQIDGVAPLPVHRVGVVGMGTMGTGITHAFALAGVPVVVLDANPAALDRGRERIEGSLRRWVQLGRLDDARAEQLLASIHTTTRAEDLSEADLIIEAAFEEVAVKQRVLELLETLCRPDTILATNTSTISLDILASGMGRPERLIGMHFFNPAHRMPLVEIIRRDSVAPEVLATALGLAKRLRKTPVVVANREGFLVNRIFVPYLQEAFFLLEDGAEPEAVDQAAVDFGFPMGPFVLMDMAGLDILVDAQRVLQDAFPHHGALSEIAVRLVESGSLGQKSGTGVYRYDPGDVRPHASPATGRIVDEVRRSLDRSPGVVPSEEITERLVLRMVNEAFHAVQEGIVQRDSDVDVALVLGTGFPDFRGGVMRYASDLGLDRVRSRLQEFSRRCGERFAPGRLLLEKKGRIE
jgi:3-hydroxyacyl-CoA dehydrogenase/enoyl-CoA hydratase/carnithine racemase